MTHAMVHIKTNPFQVCLYLYLVNLIMISLQKCTSDVLAHSKCNLNSKMIKMMTMRCDFVGVCNVEQGMSFSFVSEVEDHQCNRESWVYTTALLWQMLMVLATSIPFYQNACRSEHYTPCKIVWKNQYNQHGSITYHISHSNHATEIYSL